MRGGGLARDGAAGRPDIARIGLLSDVPAVAVSRADIMIPRMRNGHIGRLVASALVIGGCAPGGDPAGGRTERPTDARAAPVSETALLPAATASQVAGQWDVVSFNNYRPERLSGTTRAAYADFGADGVSLRLECNYTGRTGRVLDGRFVAGPPDNRVQTTIGCGPERGPREALYFSVFERDPSVALAGPDRLRLRAGRDELILERPAVRRMAYLASLRELQGEWEMVELSWFPAAGGVAGIGLSEPSRRLVIEGDRLAIGGCPALGLTFRYTDAGQVKKVAGATLPAGRVGCPALSDRADGPALPSASDAIRLLHGDPLVEKTRDGALVLSNGQHALLLRRPV